MNNEIKIYRIFIAIILIILIIISNKFYNMESKSKYYKPLDSRLTVKHSDIDGLGLFAVEDIEDDEMLGISHVYDERFKDRFIRTPLGGFINHSDNPNLEAKIDNDYRYIKTTRIVNKGEELTLKYNLYNLNNK